MTRGFLMIGMRGIPLIGSMAIIPAAKQGDDVKAVASDTIAAIAVRFMTLFPLGTLGAKSHASSRPVRGRPGKRVRRLRVIPMNALCRLASRTKDFAAIPRHACQHGAALIRPNKTCCPSPGARASRPPIKRAKRPRLTKEASIGASLSREFMSGRDARAPGVFVTWTSTQGDAWHRPHNRITLDSPKVSWLRHAIVSVEDA